MSRNVTVAEENERDKLEVGFHPLKTAVAPIWSLPEGTAKFTHSHSVLRMIPAPSDCNSTPLPPFKKAFGRPTSAV